MRHIFSSIYSLVKNKNAMNDKSFNEFRMSEGNINNNNH